VHFVLCGGGVVYDVVIAGIAQPNSWDEASSSSDRDKKASGTSSHPTSASHSPTPPPQRRLAKSFSVAPSAVTKGNYGFLSQASLQLIFWLFLDCLCLFQLPVHFFFFYFYSVFSELYFVNVAFIAVSNNFCYILPTVVYCTLKNSQNISAFFYVNCTLSGLVISLHALV
jgi:hypothetical protein